MMARAFCAGVCSRPSDGGETQPSPGRYGGHVVHSVCATVNLKMRAPLGEPLAKCSAHRQRLLEN